MELSHNSKGQFKSNIPDTYLVGKKYGKLTVNRIVGKASNGSAIYSCACECGKISKTRKGRLLSGETTSCGCISVIDLTGAKIGRLTVIKSVGKTKCGNYKWECVCDCGKKVVVRSGSLRRNSRTQSCGCLQKEKATAALTSHGLSKHPLYHIWLSMKARCGNENQESFARYGGRGIKVCHEWADDFEAFYVFSINNGWRPGLEIDRKNNSRGYYPDNCRFTNRVRNCENTRRSKYWVIEGRKYESSIKAAAGEGVHRSTIMKWCGVTPCRDGIKRNKPGCMAYLKYND